MTNYELAQWLEIQACYAANEQRPEDAWNFRLAARRLRGESEEREPEAMEART